MLYRVTQTKKFQAVHCGLLLGLLLSLDRTDVSDTTVAVRAARTD